jgi:hypothetical protein
MCGRRGAAIISDVMVVEPISAPSRPATHRRSPRDAGVAALMFAVLLFVSYCSYRLSAFIAAAADDCGSDCRGVHLAHAITWGGICAASAIAAVGTGVAAKRRSAMAVWPLVATIVVIATCVVGAKIVSFAG